MRSNGARVTVFLFGVGPKLFEERVQQKFNRCLCPRLSALKETVYLLLEIGKGVHYFSYTY